MSGRKIAPIEEVRADGVDPELVEWRNELSSYLDSPLPLTKMFGRKRARIEQVRVEWVEPELVEWRKGHDRGRSFEDDDKFLEEPQLHHVRNSYILMPPPPVPPPRRYGTPSSDPHRRGGSAPVERPGTTHLTPHRDRMLYHQQQLHSLASDGSPEKAWHYNVQQTDALAFVPSRDAPVFAPVSYQQYTVHDQPNSDLATRRAQRAAIQSARNSIASLPSRVGKRSKAVPIVRPAREQPAEPEGVPQPIPKAEVSKKPRFSMDSVIFVPANGDHNSQIPAQMPEKQDASNAGDLPRMTRSAMLSPVDAKVLSESAVLSDDDLESSESSAAGHEAQVDVVAEALGSLSVKSPASLQSSMMEMSAAAEGAEKVPFEHSGSEKHHATVEEQEE